VHFSLNLTAGGNNFNDFPPIGDGTSLPGGGTTALGGGTSISGGGTPDTGGGTPFRLNLTTGKTYIEVDLHDGLMEGQQDQSALLMDVQKLIDRPAAGSIFHAELTDGSLYMQRYPDKMATS